VRTGETVADHWEAADDAERSRLLKICGRWVLSGGRATVEQRISLERDDLLIELFTHELGPQTTVTGDANTFMI